MPLARRVLLAVCVAGAWTAFAAGIGGAGCGTDAVGVDACLAIENKRCDLSAPCVADFDVDYCKDYYRDQCLHGIENVVRNPSEADIDACLAALDQVAACQAAGIATIGECADGALLLPGADPDRPPCSVITTRPQDLLSCNFVANPEDAGPPVTVGNGGGGGSAGAGGGGGQGGGGGGGGAASSSSSATTGGAGGTGTAGGGGTGG